MQLCDSILKFSKILCPERKSTKKTFFLQELKIWNQHEYQPTEFMDLSKSNSKNSIEIAEELYQILELQFSANNKYKIQNLSKFAAEENFDFGPTHVHTLIDRMLKKKHCSEQLTRI